MTKLPENTSREEIARLATLEADTIVWLSSCPLHKSDGLWETAGYALEDIADQIVELAEKEELDEIVESIRTAREEGNYAYGTGEDDEVSCWRHIAAIVVAK